MEVSDARLEDARRQLGDPTSWEHAGERRLAIGLAYCDAEAVEIILRKRGHRYDLDDGGASVGEARAIGAARDWLALASAVVDEEGFHVNRRGVVSVGAVEGRELAKLALRLGDCAYSLHLALLETAPIPEPAD